jgi:photosystem II stability/assembly factor-like uncharacterized protein
MIDPQRGWAFGDGSALHASGFYQTTDGGRSWLAAAPTAYGNWRTGDIGLGSQAVLARDETIVQIQGPRVTAAKAMRATTGVRRLRMLDDAFGWLVGDNGLALATADGGATWLAPPFPLPTAAAQIDFRALAVWGDHLWMAGAPGSVALHSVDGGRTWEVQATGAFSPIIAITFVNATHGWAVGSLGAIVATQDGGRTWITQRRGGERLAVLSLVSRTRGRHGLSPSFLYQYPFSILLSQISDRLSDHLARRS